MSRRFAQTIVTLDKIEDHSPASWKGWYRGVFAYIPKSQSALLDRPNEISMPKWLFARMELAAKDKAKKDANKVEKLSPTRSKRKELRLAV